MASKREYDYNGWLNVADNPISRIGVYPYKGSEIGAPDPDRIYYAYRSAEELGNQETIDSFKLLPFVEDHTWIGEGGIPSEKKGVQGYIGEQVYFDGDYLRGNIKVVSNAALTAIDSGKIELSPGYKCLYDFDQTGTFKGQSYDVTQHTIRANHLALVSEGRTGSSVSVQDHSIFTIDTRELIPMTKEELMAAIAALSPEDRAELLAEINPATEDETLEEETKDELTDSEESAQASVLESVTEVLAAAIEQDADAVVEAAETIVEEAPALEEAAQVMDAMRAEIAKLKSQAMDESTIMKRIAKRDQLAAKVKPLIGTFDHAVMTMDQLAVYAAGKLGIKCAKGNESIALDAYLQAVKPVVSARALDSATSSNLKDKWGAK